MIIALPIGFHILFASPHAPLFIVSLDLTFHKTSWLRDSDSKENMVTLSIFISPQAS